MKFPFAVDAAVPAPVRLALFSLRARLEQTFSWPMAVVDDVSGLPNAAVYDRRQIIVRDIDGGGTKGLAFALDGVWYDLNGGAL